MWQSKKPVPFGLLMSSLLALSACGQQPLSADGALDQPGAAVSASQGDSVATPAGWMSSSCVHEIPNGAHVSITGLVTNPDGTTFQLPPACSDTTHRGPPAPHDPTAPGLPGGH